LALVDFDRCSVLGVVTSTLRELKPPSIARVGASARQHFLKWDAVFFCALGVFGMKCISIPECTQRTEPSHIGGQYGKEGKEEGEERSEEDCEEDPQGQEEEVSLA
jgi:hypothetical protein